MKTYKVYFEFYGRKMCTNVDAENEAKAKEIIKDKIIFPRVQELKKYDDDADFENFIDFFKNLTKR
jgi:hypothetical protein